MLFILFDLLFSIGITLGVGASTFALLFYIRALEDGTIDASEKRFMHTVYIVLRIGMGLMVFGLLATLLSNQVSITAPYLMQWTLLGIITGNAILMSYHFMPMRFGPILAGGSWYSLFFVTALEPNIPYSILLAYYGIFLVLFYVIFTHIKRRFAFKEK